MLTLLVIQLFKQSCLFYSCFSVVHLPPIFSVIDWLLIVWLFFIIANVLGEYFELPRPCKEHAYQCNDPSFLDLPIVKVHYEGSRYHKTVEPNPLSSSFTALGFARGLYFAARAVIDFNHDLRKNREVPPLCCDKGDGTKVCYPMSGPHVLKHGSQFPSECLSVL